MFVFVTGAALFVFVFVFVLGAGAAAVLFELVLSEAVESFEDEFDSVLVLSFEDEFDSVLVLSLEDELDPVLVLSLEDELDPVLAAAGLPLSVRTVAGPAIPSAEMPFVRWNSITAFFRNFAIITSRLCIKVP